MTLLPPRKMRVRTLFLLLMAAVTISATHGDNNLDETSSSSLLSPSDEFQKWTLSLPPCPPEAVEPTEHTDEVCNRVDQNDPAKRLARKLRHRSIKGYDMVNRVPEEKTWICPQDDDEGSTVYKEDTNGKGEGEGFVVGQQARWLVKNTSSGPVSLAYVDRSINREVSATNPKIYPAHADPKAILQPGQWKSILAFQGHIFHVRELIRIGDTLVPGRILLRHRPGLIPIRNKYGGNSWSCPKEALEDPDPHKNAKKILKFSTRTPENPMERCNVLHKGFVNRVGCPVDLYFAGSVNGGNGVAQSSSSYGNDGLKTMKGDTVTTNNDLNNNTTTTSYALAKTTQCREKFKMHLGLNPSPYNYGDDWDSPVKFEGTYLNHRFVARLRHDPNVVVDEVIIRGDIVGDCPGPKKVAIEIGAQSIGEAAQIGQDLKMKGTSESVLSAVPIVLTNYTKSTGYGMAYYGNSTSEGTTSSKKMAERSPLSSAVSPTVAVVVGSQ